MNPLIAIAFGGACGAVLRFLVSSGVYQWLGRGFPYGTLTVNVLGSFLIGLLTEVLVLQRIAITMEYRSAILVGLFGSFTTFSTFSLETLLYCDNENSFPVQAYSDIKNVCPDRCYYHTSAIRLALPTLLKNPVFAALHHYHLSLT
jgi:protein CrcB